MDIQAELLAEIEMFIACRQITPTAFGRLAVNDGKLVPRLRARRNMNLETINRVREFLSCNAVTAR